MIGVAHLVIFWSFLVYAVGFAWNLVRGLFPFLPVPYADEVAWMAFPWLAALERVRIGGAGGGRRPPLRCSPGALARSGDATPSCC